MVARLLITVLLVLVAGACATADPGEQEDAGTTSPDVDAGVDASTCDPDPDGESCDGTDDDCDGDTDEGYPGVGEPCEVGVGACRVVSSTVCTADGLGTECDAEAGTPAEELCGTDGDEDCDGATDEGFDIDMPCDGDGDTDLCTEGVWACNESGGRTCSDETSSTRDLCGGGNQDCDPASADGSEDPAVGLPCDGTDSDLCDEGVVSCSGGDLLCSDATGSTTELCDGTGANEDCDGSIDEGFNRNDDPTCAGTVINIGTMSGDTGAGTLNHSWYGEAWDLLRLTENNDGDVYMSATIRLYSPPGTDYDLYLYCNGCGGGAVQSSTTVSTAGHYEYLRPRWDDDWLGEDDSYNIVVEVRHRSSTLCAYWTLEAFGNTNLDDEPNTCNP